MVNGSRFAMQESPIMDAGSSRKARKVSSAKGSSALKVPEIHGKAYIFQSRGHKDTQRHMKLVQPLHHTVSRAYSG
jgi:hypothetical protein